MNWFFRRCKIWVSQGAWWDLAGISTAERPEGRGDVTSWVKPWEGKGEAGPWRKMRTEQRLRHVWSVAHQSVLSGSWAWITPPPPAPDVGCFQISVTSGKAGPAGADWQLEADGRLHSRWAASPSLKGTWAQYCDRSPGAEVPWRRLEAHWV